MSTSGHRFRRRAVPRNPHLLGLIQDKREWNWKPSPTELKRGFRGWHQRGYLPHFDAPHVTQFVTFMLSDSFPVTRRREWESIAGESMNRRRIEAWLDRGHGSCWLKRKDVANLVSNELTKEEGQRCHLHAWVIMPNHVHLVVDVWDTPLAALVAGWKGRSARKANSRLGRQGQFWQRDYYDTLVRNSEQLRRAIRYTECNPVKAHLVSTPDQWDFSSASRGVEPIRIPSEAT